MPSYDSSLWGLRGRPGSPVNEFFPGPRVSWFALLERDSELQKQTGEGKSLGGSEGRNENHSESLLKNTSLLFKVIGFSSYEKDSYTSKL